MSLTVDPAFQTNLNLEDQDLHLWLLTPSAVNITNLHSDCAACLSTAELARAEGFKRGKENHLITRLLLRRALSRYTSCAPQELVFELTEEGKPKLRDYPIEFNLSHSGDFAVLAICRQARLGVDVEISRAKRNTLEIAERYFAESEFNALMRTDDAHRSAEFYRLWTLKEAFLKALGSGIATGLHKACFELNGETRTPAQQFQAAPAQFHPEQGLDPANWQCFYTQLDATTHCALAIESPTTIRFTWHNALQLFPS